MTIIKRNGSMKNQKKQILKTKVKRAIILYTVIPAFVLVNIACFVYSRSLWDTYYTQVNYHTFQNAYALNVQFDNLVKVCNNIVTDGTVQEVFSTVQTDATRLDACEKIEKYCNHFYNSYNAQRIDVKIYHNNYSMYQTNYSVYINSIEENLIKKLIDLKQNQVYWHNTDNGSTLYFNLKNKDFTIIIAIAIGENDIIKLVGTAENYPNCQISDSDIVLANGVISQKGKYTISSNLMNGQTLNVNIPKVAKFKMYAGNYCTAYLIFLIFLVFVFVVSAKTSSGLTKKFYSLIEYISDERLYLRPYDDGGIDKNDELFSVYDKMFRLVGEINQFHTEKEKLMEENTKLQLEFAQAQINPHLLYNSLSVIKWDCMRYSAYDVSDKISLLADYYRASINRNQSKYTFSDEIELIKKYISVISKIHSTEYKYTIDFDAELLEYHTIQHIFQPLVENAILHGINRMEKGYLEISGHIVDDRIILSVKDNGYGMDNEKLEKIKNYENDDSAAYGLRNTLLRIKLHYGAGSVVKIESKLNHGTRITIMVSSGRRQDGETSDIVL